MLLEELYLNEKMQYLTAIMWVMIELTKKEASVKYI